jgi:hypothetical protein
MALLYSNLYGLAPNAGTPTWTYRGPQMERRGQVVLRFAQYTGAITFNASPALNDILYIGGGFLAGEKVKRITNTRSADPDSANDFTFNLGWRIGTAATPGSAFAAASTGMQATTAFEVGEAAALPIQAAAENDDLILTATAGAAEVTTAVHTFLVESYIP